jgi:hypothetical protein
LRVAAEAAAEAERLQHLALLLLIKLDHQALRLANTSQRRLVTAAVAAEAVVD